MNGSSRKFKNRETVFQLPKLVARRGLSMYHVVVVLFLCVNCLFIYGSFFFGRGGMLVILSVRFFVV